MKILTEEQISNIYHSTMKGNEMDYVKAICEAQARLTLQEVGEWLEKWECHFREDEILTGEPAGRIGYLSDEMVEAFKRGEMPE